MKRPQIAVYTPVTRQGVYFMVCEKCKLHEQDK